MATKEFEAKLMGLQSNLLNFAYMLTSNRDNAYDLLQDTTLKALDNESKYGENPTLEVGVINILAFVIECLESSILKEVVCVVSVRSEHECEVEKIALETHQFCFKFLVCHNSIALKCECILFCIYRLIELLSFDISKLQPLLRIA